MKFKKCGGIAMGKKQKLKSAVILGIMLSSITFGSVWADVALVEGNLYPEGLRIQGVNETYNGKGKNITINDHNDSKLLGASHGIWAFGSAIADAEARINIGSIDINVRNYVDSSAITGDEISAGILAGAETVDGSFQGDLNHKAHVDLKAENGVTIESLTRNGANSYGIYSKKMVV